MARSATNSGDSDIHHLRQAWHRQNTGKSVQHCRFSDGGIDPRGRLRSNMHESIASTMTPYFGSKPKPKVLFVKVLPTLLWCWNSLAQTRTPLLMRISC